MLNSRILETAFRTLAVPAAGDTHIGAQFRMMGPVVFVVHDFLPQVVAGTEVHVLQLAKAMSKSRSVRIFHTLRDPSRPQYELEEGEFQGIPISRIVQNYPYRSLEGMIRDKVLETLFNQLLERYRPSVVHFHHLAHLSLSLPRLARKSGATVFFTLHDYNLACPSGGQLVARALNATTEKGVQRSSSYKAVETDSEDAGAEARPATVPHICDAPSPERCGPCYAAYARREGWLEALAFRLAHLPGLPAGAPFRLFHALPLPAKAVIKNLNPPSRAPAQHEEQAAKARWEAVHELFATVDLFISPSKDLAERFIRWGLPENKLVHVPNPGPSTNEGPPIRSSIGHPLERADSSDASPNAFPPLRLVSIGSLAPHKGVERIIAALAAFSSAEVTLDVYGDLESFPAYARKLKKDARENIRFRGPCRPEQVPTILQDAHALVLGSIWPENAPLTILEALENGRPVLAPRIGGIPEQVRDGLDGLLFESGQANSLRATIKSLLTPGRLDALRHSLQRPRSIPWYVSRLEALYASFSNSSEKPTPSHPKVSIVIPTLNGGPFLGELLRAIDRQITPWPVELLIIDSGTTDGSLDSLEKQPHRRIDIQPETFNHGETRNRAARLARGDYIVFLVQDATPVGRHWLKAMVKGLEAFPDAAGAYARQLPRAAAPTHVARRISIWTPPLTAPLEKRVENVEQYLELSPDTKLRTAAFDNVCSIIRREILLASPFPKVPFGEDICWARTQLLAGRSLVYLPSAQVIHSHARGARAIIERAWLEHSLLSQLFDIRAVPDLVVLARGLGHGLRSALAFEGTGILCEIEELLGQYMAIRAPRTHAFELTSIPPFDRYFSDPFSKEGAIPGVPRPEG